MKRSSGILMHISSLPGPYGIGTFGREAYKFVDFLHASGQTYWQVLPLGPTSYGDSPYQSFSSFALNPYFVDLVELVEDGWLTREELEDFDFGEDPESVDYERIFQSRFLVLDLAYQRSIQVREEQEQLEWFQLEQHAWLQDYALYMTLKSRHDLMDWGKWEAEFRLRDPEALEQVLAEDHDQIRFWSWIQWKAFDQWNRLKEYANRRNIQIIGDIPIYAAYDSADAWANADTGIFKLDEDGLPAAVAGCPPDYFAVDGQYWGNPVYDWNRCKETGYAWWIDRLQSAFSLFDIVRIDHFRGLESYWEIPFGSPTAAYGKWVPGPGLDFIDALEANCSPLGIIAEDLGMMSEEFYRFQQACNYPGMKVLQFAFDSSERSSHLPHYQARNSVIYTGTHDNDTVIGWMAEANQHDRELAIRYLKLDKREGYHWGFIRGAWASVADLAIAPMQDVLGLGTEARMNIPSVLGGTNWKWRAKKGCHCQELAEQLAQLTRLYGRGN